MTLKRSKWKQKHRTICHKFEDAVEGTRAQTDEYWDLMTLPRKTYTPQKKPKNKILAKTQQQRRREKVELYRLVCKEVDKRDEHTCQHPGCNCRKVEHHHARYRSNGGLDVIEELVDLCWGHHRGTKDSPHQSERWRKHWEDWLERKYPIHWAKIREGKKISENSRMPNVR